MKDSATRYPLEGLRVIEVSQLVAGPLCGMILADLGAEVIKIEPPGGERGRLFGRDYVDGDMSVAFAALNRNKRSVVLDLKSKSEDRDVLRHLVSTADVVLHNLRRPTAEKLGLDYETLRHRNPSLVYLAISGFGSSGPYRDLGALDFIVQARSGLFSINGFAERPVRIAVTIVDISTAWAGATGVLAALLHRAETGAGQRIDVNLYDTALSLQVVPLSEYLTAGRIPQRFGNNSQLGAPAGLFGTADGEIVMSAYFPEQWSAFCDLIQMPDLVTDSRFATNEDRMRNEDLLYEIVVPILKARTTDEWHQDFIRRGIIATPVSTYEDVKNALESGASGVIVETTTPSGATIRSVRTPIDFSGSPRPPAVAAPGLGTAEDLVPLQVEESEVPTCGR